MEGPMQSVSGAATATADAGTGVLYSANVCSAADAATITVRTGGSGGTILCKIGAGIGASAERQWVYGVPYANLHVTISGTSPTWDLEIGGMG